MRSAPLPHRALSKATTIVLASSVLFMLPGFAQSERRVGDFLAAAIPLGTLLTELYLGDRDGAWQYGQTFAAATASVEVLKRVSNVQRPDGTNDRSFPSGHAARAFSAAAYVRQRHGLDAAAPLYLAAVYVGHTRVAARRHRWVDVVGAALLAEASANWLVHRASGTQLSLSADWADRSLGASVAFRW